MVKQQISPETVEESHKMAKSVARPGQTKEQTKLIAQGIEKGIAEYKKREKAKARERDKARKKALKMTTNNDTVSDISAEPIPKKRLVWLPWALLVLSWLGFAAFIVLF